MKSRANGKQKARLKRKKLSGKRRIGKKLKRKLVRRGRKIKARKKRRSIKKRSRKRKLNRKRRRGRRKRRTSRNIESSQVPENSRGGLVPGSNYRHIFAFEIPGTPEVWVDPAVWDRIVANLPPGYKIPDRAFADLLYPGLF